jgi:citrate lyase subunit beta / citryl-CoA lyase
MRSKLFVPGSRPELFDKAMASAADAISIDLEDAVAESRKAEARETVSAFLPTVARSRTKVVIVRVNAMSTPHFVADVSAVVRAGLDLLNVPKLESPDEVREAAAALEAAERSLSGQPGAPIGLLLNIESPRGLRRAVEIAAAHPRVAGLQIGYGDLFEPLQIARNDAAAVHSVMLAVRLAAGEAGVFALDGAFAGVNDPQAYRLEAQAARRLGFLGKSCIHPSQIPIANDVFRPADDEIAHALRVVAAAADAQARGVGAYLVDGRMVDGPFVLRAHRIVAAAQRLGLLDPSRSDPNQDPA